MFHTSKIEISKSALQNNLDFLRGIIGPEVVFSSVVKGNAYGHGIENFVPLAESCGVKHFSVFSAVEAFDVKQASSDDSEVMIMGMIANDALEWAIQNEVQFFVFELDRLEHAIQVAKDLGIKARIHLELETGMNRTGFSIQELRQAVPTLIENEQHIELEGLCTHYAGAESIANHVRVKRQIRNFKKLRKLVLDSGLKPKKMHTACSAAAMRYPETRMDMVRIGILQYGFWPSRETFIHYMTKQDDGNIGPFINRLITWRSTVMSTKEVAMGEFIGYGTSFLAQHDMEIALIPIGYSHGFSRALSNSGRVLIQGQRVSVIGIVNMNAMAVDISGLNNTIQKGDEVILIGEQGNLEVSVSSFSDLSNQLNYELLTRLPHDIPRVVVN